MPVVESRGSFLFPTRRLGCYGVVCFLAVVLWGCSDPLRPRTPSTTGTAGSGGTGAGGLVTTGGAVATPSSASTSAAIATGESGYPSTPPRRQIFPGPLGHERWPDETIRQLEGDAAKGDGQAAWALSVYYGVNLHDGRRSGEWVHRAAVLRNPNAEQETAELIRSGLSYAPYGDSEPAARQQLLEDACRTNASACRELADSFDAGSCGGPKPNHKKARLYYQRGAELGDQLSWDRLAAYLHQGLGGPVDEAGAYFWTSIQARCTAPDSVGGKKTWSFRERLAASLPLAELEKQWAAVDQFMAEYYAGIRDMLFPPFFRDMVPDDVAFQSERDADARENEHRSRLREPNSCVPKVTGS